MIEVNIEIKLIEKHYVEGRYIDAYDTLFNLCNRELCNEFYIEASSIITRHNDLENLRNSGVLDLTQHEQKKREIGSAYLILIIKIKKRFDSHFGFNNYEEQAIRMKENQDILKKAVMDIEDDYDLCECSDKGKVLEQIIKDMKATIKYFRELVKNFKRIQSL